MAAQGTHPRRSWVVVPGSKADLAEEAARRGADVVVLDLVDFVREEQKPLARDAVGRLSEQIRSLGSEVFLQVDSTALVEDLLAGVSASTAGVVLANARTTEDVLSCDRILGSLEKRLIESQMERAYSEPGSPAGSTLPIVLSLESAMSNWRAYELASASSRVSYLSLARADLKMDLRPEPSSELHLMEYLMQRLVVIARSTGCTPLGAWWRWPDRGMLANPARTYAAALRGRMIGFTGALCIMPAQAEPLNEAFSSGDEQPVGATCRFDDDEGYLADVVRLSASELRAEQRPSDRTVGDPRAMEEGAPPCPGAPSRVRRSGLEMPIVTDRFVDHAWRRQCDVIILDLEDSVPDHLKDDARSRFRVAAEKVVKGGADLTVRVNHELWKEDVEAVLWPPLRNIRHPKTESAEEIRRLDDLISRLEPERGFPLGSVEITASIETARGISNVMDIASSSPRIKGFGAGGGYDMSSELGIEMFVPYDQFVYQKGEAELVARSLDLEPLGRVFLANLTGSVSDPEYATRYAEAAFRAGFRTSHSLNPATVEAANRGYTPDQEALDRARMILAAYDRLLHSDDSWMTLDGEVIDVYEANRARELIEWARRCRDKDEEKAYAIARARAAAEA